MNVKHAHSPNGVSPQSLDVGQLVDDTLEGAAAVRRQVRAWRRVAVARGLGKAVCHNLQWEVRGVSGVGWVWVSESECVSV